MAVLEYLKKEKVLSISLVLAAVSALFVHPDKAYASYVDLRVLALLFCLMLLVKGFQSIGLFDLLIEKVFGGVKDSRTLSRMLILLCFFTSMLITNDVALITFVPFAILALSLCGMQSLTIRVVVLQTIAANLGSMATPIGNPQNLYLFTASGMGIDEFFGVMLPLAAVSLALILLVVQLMIPKTSIKLETPKGTGSMPKAELIVYTVLFIVNLLVVFRVITWIPALIVTAAGVLLMRRVKLFAQVDYALLLTFVGFFVFVGNLGRVPAISEWLKSIISGREIQVSALFSQCLSNVPAALLMSGFTDNYRGLLVGTNVGGLGTLIASMASLISYKLYAAMPGSQKGRYMLEFTVFNVAGFAILLVLSMSVFR